MAEQERFEQLDAIVQAILSGSAPGAVPQELRPLADIAAILRDLPRPEFREELKMRLKSRPEPQTITSYIIVTDAIRLAEFVKKAFGAKEMVRAIGSAGGYHIEVQIEDSTLMIGGGGEGSQWSGDAKPASLHYYVRDVDAVYRRALDAGATSLYEPMDQDYGDRDAAVKDQTGNEWYIGTSRGAQYRPAELRAITPYLHPVGAADFISFLVDAFGATEIARHPSPEGTIAHALVRIGNSVIEMGEAHAQWQPMSSAIFCSVGDADAAYARAIGAGARSVWAPDDRPFGRSAAVEDPQGNHWYITAPRK